MRLALSSLGFLVVALQANAATITVDPNTTFQRMLGWEFTGQAGQSTAEWPTFGSALMDQAVSDLGVNRARLGIRSGVEHNQDNYARWRAGQLNNAEWRSIRYATVNDNADPFVINPAGFQWTDLDEEIEKVTNPMRQRLAARGESLYVSLNYTAFTGIITPPNTYGHAVLDPGTGLPEEYAEFVLAAFLHIQSKYGWVPDAFEMFLEPDNTAEWQGLAIGRAIVAVGQRLAANGFHPEIIAPSTTCMSNAPSYFDDMMTVPGVATYLKELSYHRYCGVSDSNLDAIRTRAAANGLRTSMLEHIDSGVTDILKDLTLANVSAWQQFALAFPQPATDGSVYYSLTLGPSTSFRLTTRAVLLRQFFKYIRRGAVRVAATSDLGGVWPVAFRSANGTFVVVSRVDNPGAIDVVGLPAGTYSATYAAAPFQSDEATGTTAISLPDTTITAGQTLTVTMPETGVLSIFVNAPPVARPSAPSNLRLR